MVAGAYVRLYAGHLCVLKYPYPRDVDEIHDYQFVTEHFLSHKAKPDPTLRQSQVYSVSIVFVIIIT